MVLRISMAFLHSPELQYAHIPPNHSCAATRRKESLMRGYIVQIEAATRDNQHYRRVLFYGATLTIGVDEPQARRRNRRRGP